MMIVEYRVFTAEALSGTPVMELPQYGMYMNKTLSGEGQYTGFFRLGNPSLDSKLLDGTIPGRHAVVVQRNGINIWSGPITSRTYASEGETVQINASTFEMIFSRIVMENDQIHQNAEQQTILTNWLSGLQAQTGCNFGLVLDCAHNNNVARTILIPAYEYHYASDLLDQMQGVGNGIDYTINLAASGDNPTRTLKVRYALTAFESSGAFWDYPGTVTKYWMNESGSSVARRSVALGAGTGNQLMKSVNTNGSLTSWPMWTAVESFPDIGDQAGLDAKSAAMSSLYTPPVYGPTFILGPESNFAGWNDLGKLFSVYINDLRFPSGLTITTRMLAWQLTPASDDGPEQIQFTLESDS